MFLNHIQQTEPNNPLLYLKKADLHYNLEKDLTWL